MAKLVEFEYVSEGGSERPTVGYINSDRVNYLRGYTMTNDLLGQHLATAVYFGVQNGYSGASVTVHGAIESVAKRLNEA